MYLSNPHSCIFIGIIMTSYLINSLLNADETFIYVYILVTWYCFFICIYFIKNCYNIIKHSNNNNLFIVLCLKNV